MKKRVLSGIQPTGNLHLGNYLGAIKNWLDLQDQNECFFFLVDLHALTSRPNPQELTKHSLEGASLYLACGLDPTKSSLFLQSHIPEHCELMWILSCYTPLGWLNRMTQFKEKAGKNQQNSVLGLYSYPVLMASDILLYNADLVPVGDDQKQHIELTRDIANSFNQLYENAVFRLPDPLIIKTTSRIMSLRDGAKKMSKSDISDGSRINLLDTPNSIQTKIKKAKTHGGTFPENAAEAQKSDEVYNLLNIASALSERSLDDLCNQFSCGNFSPFKEYLIELLVQKLTPIQKKFSDLMTNRGYLCKILKEGGEKARDVARDTLKHVKDTIGICNF